MKNLDVLLMSAALLCAASLTVAAEKSPVRTTPELDRLVRQLEESGALDAAIDRGVQRYMQKQKETELAQQAASKRALDEQAGKARKVNAQRDRIFGNPAADVSVIVYTDLECPYCQRFAGTPERAIEKFKGKANVVLRHFPLSFHGDAAKRGAYVAECVGRQAGSGAVFVFVNSWFKATQSNGKGLERGEAQIHELAKAAGATDAAALDACASAPVTAQRVSEDMDDGTLSGVRGTPSVIVRNNRSGRSQIIVGAVASEKIEQAITELLGN